MRFNIATDQGILQVEGEPITIGKWKCFIHENIITGSEKLSELNYIGESWLSFCELSSGMKISESYFWGSAYAEAKELLESHDYWTIKKKILSELQRNGISYPINK